MIAIVALSFYKSPVTTGIGVGVFLVGVPLYGIIILVRDRPGANRFMGKFVINPFHVLLMIDCYI